MYEEIGTPGSELEEGDFSREDDFSQEEEFSQDDGLADEIAVVGMAGRFPGAASVDELWHNLERGLEAVRSFTEEELLRAGVDPERLRDPNYVRAGTLLEGIEELDARFFGFSPREAEITDPQHRLLLECAHQALEHAGIDPGREAGHVGVFAGSILSTYLLFNLMGQRSGDPERDWSLALANAQDSLATRVAYKLDLKGPAITVQTACSTSLVAIHMARHSLLNFECDTALAGGVTVRANQGRGYLYQEEGILSPDGRCRAFDAEARGTVFSSGVGLVVLKRLEDALEAGDTVYAVVKGSAVNNDGAGKAGFTAPSAAGQAEVVARALASAEVDPSTISYVETHGTGTALGDPIEIGALQKAFRASTDRKGFCAVGSVKTNIGHLDAAAGVAGFIKTVQALRHRTLPPSLHFRAPNPRIDFASSPFFVNTESRPWKNGDGPRRAGVSAFGVGGTNAHVILEEAPPPPPSGESRPLQLLSISARTVTALERATDRLAAFLGAREGEGAPAGDPHAALADIAYTLHTGRQVFEHRRVLWCHDSAEAAVLLAARDPARLPRAAGEVGRPATAFLFPGQGAQYAGMTRGLYESEPEFCRWVDRCADLLRPRLGEDLRRFLYPEAGDGTAAARLERTAIAQPALFVVEYALARLWRSWGVVPQAMLGHSVGEYVAACLAGVFTLEDALALVAERGRLMERAPEGAMLAVELSEAEMRERLGGRLGGRWNGPAPELAAVNGARRTVVAGTPAAIEELARRLGEEGCEHRRLATSHAFHSRDMDPVLDEFEARVAEVPRRAPHTAFVSNVSGRWIEDEEAVSPAYWRRHLRSPVRFADGLEVLFGEPDRLLLEVGPGRTLAGLARRHPRRRKEQTVLSSLAHRRDATPEPAAVAETLGRLWLAGLRIDWHGYYGGEKRRRVALPTYPFERRRYWIEPAAESSSASPAPRRAENAATVSRAAAAPAEASPGAPSGAAAPERPETAAERRVATVWSEVLGVDAPGRHDDFFELGGDSLVALQMLRRLREEFPGKLDLQLLFDHPRLADLAATLSAVAQEAVAQEAVVQEEKAADPGAAAVPEMTVRPPDEPAILSYSQKRLWFLDQLEPGNPQYNIGALIGLEGALSAAALTRGLRATVARHEILRTVFAAGDPEAVQEVLPSERLPASWCQVPVVDLGGLPAAARERQLNRLSRDLGQRSFDLVRGPLFRSALLRLGAERCALAFVLHHIVSDGWSMGVMVRDLGALYQAALSGRPADLPALVVQYADFARWEQRWLRSELLERQLEWWRERLRGLPPALELPSDRPRPAAPSGRGGRCYFRLPAARLAALERFHRERGVTLYMVLLAVFDTLLHRTSQQDDFAVGTPVAGRHRDEVEELIGFFVNSLVLRSEPRGEATFLELLDQVRQTALAAFEHQELPFDLLVEDLAPDRDLSRTPLFQVFFALQNQPVSRWETPGLVLRGLEMSYGTAWFDLSLDAEERSGELVFFLEYSSDLFDRTTAGRWASSYLRLLTAVVEEPRRSLAVLPLLGDAEEHQVRVAWNDTDLEDTFSAVFETFAGRASSVPERTAVVATGEVLTYGELHRRAAGLARWLVDRGVAAEDPVALLADRGPDFATALLAILGAGGAYLPLEPAWPAARWRRILTQSGARHAVVGGRLKADLEAELAALPNAARPRIWDLVAALSSPAAERPLPRIDPERLAYVLFTSGSTGQPKGAMLTHRGMVNHLRTKHDGLRIGPGDAMAQTASQCFDISVWQFLAVLQRGGRLHIYGDAVAHDPARLLRRVAADRVTILEIVPSLLQVMLETLERPGGDSRELDRLRWLIPTGEALPPELCRRWLRLRPDLPLVNAYGPTECSDDVTLWTIRTPPPLSAPRVPVGRPLANLLLYITDRRLRRLPLGAHGELCVSGAGVGRGYLRDPRRSAEVFVPDACSGGAGERLYRTGDLARFRSDGVIEYLDRIDYQVKVRGFRIELGEIEAVLRRTPGVRQAAVTVRGERSAEHHLVAWWVAADGAPPAVSELREHLGRQLPEYMVPTVFARLSELPLSANGKIDRKALGRSVLPAGETEAARAAHRAPRGPMEETVAGIWCDVLGRERVSVRDNFFELGGHSLLATRVMSRLRQVLSVEIPLRTLFENPTVERLARRIEEASRAVVAPIVAVPRTGGLPLSFAQERLWFLDRMAPGGTAYNIPIAIRMRGRLDAQALERSLGALVERHETLRTEFAERAAGPVQVIRDLAAVRLARVDLAALGELREAEARRLAAREAATPFDLTRAPLLRAWLGRLGERDHLLVVNVHHIVADGWSMAVMVRDTVAHYRGASPAALPVGYADFALWQRRTLRAEVLEREVRWWSEELAGVPRVLELPADRPRPRVRSDRGAILTGRVPPAVIERLQALSRAHGATLFMTALAAYQVLLGRHARRDTLLVGSPVAGRNRAEVEDLVGFFVNALPLKADLSGDPTFAELLVRTRETTLGAYAHQDLPFEKLVDELRVARDTSRPPLCQVMFAFEQAPVEVLELPELSLSYPPLDLATAKFDFTLTLTEMGEGLKETLEFSTDLFDATMVRRLSAHLATLLAGLPAAAGRPISELPHQTPGEEQQLLREWNDTRAPVPGPRARGLAGLFELQVDRAPDAVALVFERPGGALAGGPLAGGALAGGPRPGEGLEQTSYAELERRANRLAHQLLGLGLEPGERVGISLARSPELLVALLGTLKAGLTYVPLEPGWPAERKSWILSALAARCLITDAAQSRPLHDVVWRLPRLREVIFLDVNTPDVPPEPVDEDVVRGLWDHLAEEAVDDITAGGFVSMYTGRPMRRAEVEAYRDRVAGLARARLARTRTARARSNGEPGVFGAALGAGPRVLEIGCGSGLLLFELAGEVERYVGLDPSPRTQAKNRADVDRRGLGQVELVTGFAHELEERVSGPFDLVILASTVHFFPGPAYLRQVLRAAATRLAPGGAILVADVPDPRQRDELRRSLEEFRARQEGDPEVRTKTRLDELYVDEDFFADVAAEGFDALEVCHRSGGFENELRFRYDVVLARDEAPGSGRPARRQGKHFRTRYHQRGLPAARPRLEVLEDSVAYVIFTSGSTGTPKGVVVQHHRVRNLISWVNTTFGVGPRDRLLFITSPCFDLSVYDVFGILAAGGAVRIASEDDLGDPAALLRLLEEGVTFWDSAPAALGQLVPLLPGQRRPGQGRDLRLVFLSGDWIPVALPDQVRSSFPAARLVSLGGATEAVIWSNVFPIGEVDPGWKSIPYGRPITNARYLVLDRRLSPCPIGVTGDLYIGGKCLALGYSAARLSAERFLPDPWDRAPGARLYRTGDLACHLGDGNLEFQGRADHQVKVRGFRIELGEIEVSLARHPSVKTAVVVARQDRPGDQRLVAYVVPAGAACEPDELRQALGERLPAYMVPAAFVVLDHLPVSPTGKLDRAALPAPTWGDEEAFVAPRTPTEESLAEIWSELLGVARLGIEDDFFVLGGHSLLATQVASRMRTRFDVEVGVRALFEDRTIARLARRIDGAARAELPPVTPVSRESDPPASSAQERLWLVQQMAPRSAAYNLSLVLRISGKLDVAALRASLAGVVARHEALRTTFAERDGRLVQVIDVTEPGAVPIAVPLADLGALRIGREAAARRLLEREAAVPFDLGEGPLVRALLCRLAAAEHLLAVHMHHIVSDGWSLGVMVREWAALYRGDHLAPLGVQYADFAAWQRRHLSGETLEREVGWWRRQLGEPPPRAELPTDRPRPSARSERGGALPVVLPSALVAGAQHLAQRSGATLFHTTLAALQLLLAHLTGRRQLLIGSPIAQRNRVETEGLIGFFVNTLVLRGDLTGDPTFLELLDRARETALLAAAHQDVPFERLVEELQPGRDPSRVPFFEVAFAIQNEPLEEPELPGLALRGVPGLHNGTSKFDLTIVAAKTAEGRVEGTAEFGLDLFDATTVKRWCNAWRTLLEAAVEEPRRPVRELALLALAERQQLLVEESDSASAYPRDRGLAELFEAQAEARPDAVAVIAPRLHLSYRELERRANRLGRHLEARASEGLADTPVGLYLERSPELIVGMLAILKAGGAYLPLDLDYPEDRLAFMIEDAGVDLVISRRGIAERPERLGGTWIFLDEDEAAIDARPAARPAGWSEDRRTAARALAYLVYTSGSTGVPKGVAVPQRAVVRLVRETNYLPFAAGLRLAQAASATFDAATFEIWGALVGGGTTVIVERSVLLSPEKLRDELERRRITTLFLTTAVVHLMGQVEPRGFAALDHLLFGGEAVVPRWVRRIAEAGAPWRLLHVYGPTESTTFASWHPIGPIPAAATTLPIGRALANTTLHVEAPGGLPAAPGVWGELLIGGDGLARGYHLRPALTAAAFVPDRWTGQAGRRLYRTGDRVRRLASGDLEIAGRFDHQVKLRGFRVELGEIEAELGRAAGVREAVVTISESAPGEKLLVAWLRLAEGEAPPPADLREALGRRLPEYMVPGTFVVLDALPLTPSGKLDRNALARRSPERGGPEDRPAEGRPGEGRSAEERSVEGRPVEGRPAEGRPAEGRGARSLSEELVLEIWRELFGGAGLGVDADFFALGGHSLMAVQVVSRLRQTAQVEIPLQALFDHPTAAGLAAYIDTARRDQLGASDGGVSGTKSAAAAPDSVPIVPVDRDQALPVSFSQHRLWILDEIEPGSAAYTIPFALELDGELDPAALERSLGEIVRRHEILRTVFAWYDAEPAQEIDPYDELELPEVDLRALSEDARRRELERRMRADAARGFDLMLGPLVSFVLVALAPRRHVLLVNMHHIISDAWSLEVFLDELRRIYGAFLARRPSPLGELAVQYADFAVWQRQALSGDLAGRLLAYWRERLEGVPPTFDLPADRPRPARATLRGRQLPVALPAALTEGLRELARERRVTLNMTLLAAFKALLALWTGRRQIVVGTPAAGRNRPEIEGLIGFFVNDLVLATDSGGDPPWTELLGRVSRTLLAAHDHQDLPFARLVEALDPPREQGRHPLFQIMFQLLHPPADLTLPGLAMRPRALPREEAKFDLGLALADSPGGISGTFEFSADLFDPSTLHRLIGHFRTLLEAAVERPELRLSQLPRLRRAEEHALRIEWQGGRPEAAALPPPAGVRVERVAARLPEALALAAGARRLTYRELDRRAGRLARRLRALGVGPERRVGICLERGPELVIAGLATWKAGGAFVPLDPSYPDARLQFMLSDAAVRVLITDGAHREGLVGPWTTLLLEEGEGSERATEAAPAGPRAPEASACPTQLAYVIYTSGSTGRPKGVAVSHSALVSFLAWHRSRLGVAAGDRASQVASPGFDASICEIWAYLSLGASVHVVDEEARRIPVLLRDFLIAERITAGLMPTPLAESVLDLDWPASAPLGFVLAGGDRLRRRPSSEIPFRLINDYGPTETTILVTSGPVRSRGEGHPDIGRPIDGVLVRVAGRRLEAQPIGAPGELLIGGGSLARGYLGRPGLSAERFVPDPWSDGAGERLYRTGDLVRHLSDGRLDFLGRMDHQVQLRGVRIEPGEIEAVLGEHPELSSAVVVARQEAGEWQLIGYVVPREEAEEVAGLREWLHERLPGPMVPSHLMVLAELPVDAHGKVDRSALPTPGSGVEHVAPRSGVEELTAMVWQRVLGRENLSVYDDFFAIGGHSLLATQIVSGLRELFGEIELPLSRLFEAPTIAGLAAEIELALEARGGPELPYGTPEPPPPRAVVTGPESSLFVLQPDTGSGRPPLFLFHPVSGDILCYVELVSALGPAQPVYGVRARGLADGRAPLTGLEAMAAAYLDEIRRVVPEGPYCLGGWSMGGVVAFEMARQLLAAAVEVAPLLLVDSRVASERDKRASAEETTFWSFFLDDLGIPWRDAGISPERFLELGTEARLASILAAAHTVRVVPASFGLEEIRALHRVYRANLDASNAYEARPAPVRAVVLQAAHRIAVSREDLLNDWRPLAADGLEIHSLPGDHQSILRGENARTVAQHIHRLYAVLCPA